MKIKWLRNGLYAGAVFLLVMTPWASVGAAAPTAPTNLAIPTPTLAPSLTWSAVSGATSYNIYRMGSQIGSSSTTSYVDNAAPTGRSEYYVTAVNADGESSPSTSRSTFVDRYPPQLGYTVSTEPTMAGWYYENLTISFICSDVHSSIQSCTSPVGVTTEGANQEVIGTAVDTLGNTTNGSVLVNLDKTAPTVSNPLMNPLLIALTVLGTEATFSAAASDNLAGVAGGEFFIDSDPGVGQGGAMTFANGRISGETTIQGLSLGTHTLYMRAQDAAGHWSSTTQISFLMVL